MSDPRRLMGRLNPLVSRYDAGRGGTPELTPQDIAAALGMARSQDEFACEVFCACWWPDGARLTTEKLESAIRTVVMSEYSRRHLDAVIAKLDCHIAEGEFEARRSKTTKEREELATARAKRSRSDASKWPWNVTIYRLLPGAILSEIRDRRLCPECGGKQYVRVESLPVPCERCDKTGQISASNVSRAQALEITEAGFRTVWRDPYEWTLRFVAEKEAKGAAAVRRALGDAPSDDPDQEAA